MNPRWDASLVRTQLAELRIPLDQRVGTLVKGPACPGGAGADAGQAAAGAAARRAGRGAGSAGAAEPHGWRGFVTYQRASRYWPFRGIETGIYVLLAAALIAVTFVIVCRRDA